MKLHWMIVLAGSLFSIGMANADTWSLSCPEDAKSLPHLVASGETLEPSGIAWDPVNKVVVGVSDEASPHSLFVFDPNQKGDALQAYPLLIADLVSEYKPKDFEAITRLPSGEFVASASHSSKKGKTKDTVLRFRLKKGSKQPWEIEALQRIPSQGGFHSWLVQSANPPWDKSLNDQEAETGINMEGMAASLQQDSLLFGFRGPVLDDRMLILAARLDPKNQLTPVKWHRLKLSDKFDLSCQGGKVEMGVRDMTPIAGKNGNEYLILVGASKSGKDAAFQVGWWREDQDQVTYVGRLAKGFRAEGITVLNDSPEGQKLLLVSDKHAMVMNCETKRSNR